MKRSNLHIPKFFIALFLVGFIGSCNTAKKTTKYENKADLYNPSTDKISPALKVYHQTGLSSQLILSLEPEELLFNHANNKNKYLARIRVNCQMFYLFDDEPGTEIIDSVTKDFEITLDEAQGTYMDYIDIPAEEGQEYALEVVVIDLNRQRKSKQIVRVDKTTTNTRQNFLMVDGRTGRPILRDYLHTGESVRLVSARNQHDKVHVSYFKNTLRLPPPVFSPSTPPPPRSRPDSVFVMDYNPGKKFLFAEEGIYHFRFDTLSPDGCSVFFHGENFPAIKNTADMIGPLAYLTNSADFNELQSSSNKKLSLDNFWLALGNDIPRAKELIRIYYNRVRHANIYFTADREGWMTDRGMVYIIYGQPQFMIKEFSRELWMYYSPRQDTPITFEFNHRDNVFSANDYILKRKDEHSLHWRKAIDTWRGGEVFIFR